LAVLTHIETTLQQSLVLALDSPAPPGLRGESAPMAPLRVLDERLAQWKTRIDLTEGNAAEVDRLLNAEARALEDWAQALAAAEEKLAKCVGATSL